MNRLRNSPYKKRIITTTLLVWFLYVTSSLCFANCAVKTPGNTSSIVTSKQNTEHSHYSLPQTSPAIKANHCESVMSNSGQATNSKQASSKQTKNNGNNAQETNLPDCCFDDCSNQEQIVFDGKTSSVTVLLFISAFSSFEYLSQHITVVLTDYFHQVRQKIPIPDIFLMVCSFLK